MNNDSLRVKFQNWKRTADLHTLGTIAFVVITLLVVFLLYPKPREKLPDGVTEIIYWTHPFFLDGVRPAIEEFERRNPQYRVIMGTATTRDASGDPSRFLLSLAGGVPPDVIAFDRFAIVEWASRGAFTDLNKFIEADQGREDALKREDFFAPAWDETIYKGSTYAIPSDVDTRALFYRHDPLIRAGFVDEEGKPRPPETWEELCLKKLQAKGNVSSDGRVTLNPASFNESETLSGDIVVLISGSDIFRARIESVISDNELQIDFSRELPRGTEQIPLSFQGDVEVKIFDQESYVSKLTRFDSETGAMTEAAFIPFYGNSWLYLYGWLNGAQFMSEDGADVMLDSPEVVEALQWLVDVHDCMGGAEKVNAFQSASSGGGIEPFLADKVVMFIDRDAFMGTIMAFRPDLNFGVVATPQPAERELAGFESVGWGGGWGHAIPSTAADKEGAWELIRWLSSEEANKLTTEARATFARSKGRPFFPALHANKNVMAWLQETYVDGNPAVSQDLRDAYQSFAELLPVSRYRPVTPVGQKLWSEHVRATEAAVNHVRTAEEALASGSRETQRTLDRFLNPPTGPQVNWTTWIWSYVVLLIVLGIIIFIYAKQKLKGTGSNRRLKTEWFEGFVCASPWLIGFAVLYLGPILFSLLISFTAYDVLNPPRWIGFDNFTSLLGTTTHQETGQVGASDPIFWVSVKNTAFMMLKIPLDLILGLGLALLLNHAVRGQRIYRTIYYLPAVVPTVAGFLLWFYLYDPSLGLLNRVLRFVGVSNPPNWLLDPDWSKPSILIMTLWSVGQTMVIWLAGLQGVPKSLLESAKIDGAGAIKRFWHVTLPMISPYLLFNSIITTIAVLQTFEASYVMTSGGPSDSTLFYAYKLFNEAFRLLDMGSASAMAWLLFVVILILTLIQLGLGKRYVHYEVG